MSTAPDKRDVMDIFKIPVHPACEVFPMLDDDELQELAEDIKENGLRNPIVVGEFEGKKVLIDGKNRRAACERAGVVPEVRELGEDEDLVAFIFSMNIFRKSLSQGQRAMGFAKLYPDPPRGRGHKDPARKGAEKDSLSYRRVKEARFVLRHLPELAHGVLAGAVSLDEAVKQAQQAKAAREDYEREFTRLKNWRPTLADAVTEGTISLAAALATAAEGDEQERRARHALSRDLMDITALPALFANDRIADVAVLLSDHPAQFEKSAEISVAAFIKFLLEDAKRYGEMLKDRLGTITRQIDRLDERAERPE